MTPFPDVVVCPGPETDDAVRIANQFDAELVPFAPEPEYLVDSDVLWIGECLRETEIRKWVYSLNVISIQRAKDWTL